MIDDLAMNAYLSGYIAALRNRHRPADAALPENPYVDNPAQRASWLEGYKDATEEFGSAPTRQSTLGKLQTAVDPESTR
jgi:ribosome modulation factor